MTSYIHQEINNKGSYAERVEYVYFYDTSQRLWVVDRHTNKDLGTTEYFNNKDELKYCYPEFKFIKEEGD